MTRRSADPTTRIAIWSGPRNLSTAMMRCFEARGDCGVVDEPFYGAYLKATGVDHPMREEIIASMPTDVEQIAEAMAGPAPGGEPVFYQKQMPHHLYLSGAPLEWMKACRHAILIRAPERMIASFDAKRPAPDLNELAIPQMDRIDSDIADLTGAPPPVIEAEDVRANPAGMMRSLCAALDIPFKPAMLRWPAGARANDGIWGAHWYRSVETSTGFAPPAGEAPELAPHLAEAAAAARPAFERLQARKLGPV